MLRSIPLGVLFSLLSFVAVAEEGQPSAGPAVNDIVEFSELVQPSEENDDELASQVSPDGSHAVIVVRKADVSIDKNRYDIQLLDLSPSHLAAQRFSKPITVFSAIVDRDNHFGIPAIQDVRWHGNGALAFLGRLKGESMQVYRLGLEKRELVQLTHEQNQIVSYAASADLRRVVYVVQLPNPPLRKGAREIVVGSQSFWSVKFGQENLSAQQRIYQYFVADAASPREPRALGPAFEGNGLAPPVSIAPDGRWALLHRQDPDHAQAWEHQYPMVAEVSGKFREARQVDPLRYFSSVVSYVPRITEAWHLDDRKKATVLDAPDDALPGGGQLRSDLLWQGAGASILLAGTHLPVHADGTGSLDSHVIEYWPDTGKWADVATLDGRLEEMRPVGNGFVVIDGARRRLFHRDAGGTWRESAAATGPVSMEGSAWVLHVAQGPNVPPDIYAVQRSGAKTRLTQLNPQFDATSWGSMQPYSWKDAAGRRWNGGLMSGAGMDPHKRYPLVIQTYGFAPDRFYLAGPNTSDGATSAFAGRAFLREGILVLAFPWSAAEGPPRTGQEALQAFNDGVRAAVKTLAEEGRIDPSKVGIIGWSATGERVLNLLAFGDVKIRAATTADGDANTTFALTVTYGMLDTMWGRLEALNEGLPFGEKLATWVRNDPSLHTDCIHAALRIESYGPTVLPNWDVYALLRRQYKPAEMIVIPDGSHQLGSPGDRMSSLQGNVDWYAFWLAGKARTVPHGPTETESSLRSQYERWRKMQELKAIDDTRPRCMR